MNRAEIQWLISKSQNIHGWFSKEAAMLIGALDEFQKTHNINGNIFEIGVHHGKSTILFNSLLRGSEQLKVCDIFGLQEHNTSGSGSGEKEIFVNNIYKYSSNNLPEIYTCLSSDLSPNTIGTNYRMFHIDGGHNRDEALSDLLLASVCINKEGIIILDDPFRPEWPGVTEASIEFLTNNPDFIALAVGFNKLIISKKEVSNDYLKFLDDTNMHQKYLLSYPYNFKKLPFMDNELRIFYLPSFMNPGKSKTLLHRSLKDVGIYKFSKRMQEAIRKYIFR